jgi:hypothetical protein
VQPYVADARMTLAQAENHRHDEAHH